MSDSITTVTPTITLPINMAGVTGQIEAFKLWVSIPANDDTGVLIDNVMAGDQIQVYDASGIASFKETSMKLVKGIVGVANAIAGDLLLYATDGTAAPFVMAWNKAVQGISDAVGDSDIKHARRDQYGRDPGTGDYGKDEGGLIVCMPESKGVIYATDDFHFADGAKSHGREYQYYSAAAKNYNVLFPSNVSGGRLTATASIPGAVHVLAFDSNFKDNAGSYTVGLLIIRGIRPSGRTVEQLAASIRGAAPSSGM